jgi:hypothetical protein
LPRTEVLPVVEKFGNLCPISAEYPRHPGEWYGERAALVVLGECAWGDEAAVEEFG